MILRDFLDALGINYDENATNLDKIIVIEVNSGTSDVEVFQIDDVRWDNLSHTFVIEQE